MMGSIRFSWQKFLILIINRAAVNKRPFALYRSLKTSSRVSYVVYQMSPHEGLIHDHLQIKTVKATCTSCAFKYIHKPTTATLPTKNVLLLSHLYHNLDNTLSVSRLSFGPNTQLVRPLEWVMGWSQLAPFTCQLLQVASPLVHLTQTVSLQVLQANHNWTLPC